jgi:hypothetical protein
MHKVARRFVQVAMDPDQRGFRPSDQVGHPIRGDSYRMVGFSGQSLPIFRVSLACAPR